MLVKVDEATRELLCCPFCRFQVGLNENGYACHECGRFFPKISLSVGKAEANFTYDFRLHKPDYAKTESERQWAIAQAHYLKFYQNRKNTDALEEYLAEIESVREIYTEEFHFSGSVLDVGGGIGKLRYYLGDDVTHYVSIDPLEIAFDDIAALPNLFVAYPQLRSPCNFIIADAEHLPFKSNSFDWVHMRSCLDHFCDPFIALLEGYRCAKADGKLLIGLMICEKYEAILQERQRLVEQQPSTSPAFKQRIKKVLGDETVKSLKRMKNILSGVLKAPIPGDDHDDHMFRFTYDELLNICTATGWSVKKEHWQKAPFEFCLYAMFIARKG